jgi:uncharacterized damage-inducible protein DinB
MPAPTSTTTAHPPSATIPAARALLAQCRGFLSDLDDASYTEPCPAMFNATIGAHVRHTLDHFAAALGAQGDEAIDYDHRERDTPVEKSVEAAVALIDDIDAKLDALTEADADRDVRIRVMLSGDGDETRLASTLARELAFAAHHGVHHHAMIASIAMSQGRDVPAGFGKAPSTIAYESSR